MNTITDFFEISRFTYFVEDNKSNNNEYSEFQGLNPWTEIEDRERLTGKIDLALPFSKSLQYFWSKQSPSFQTTEISGQQMIAHSFPAFEKKVFIFETKIKVPFESISEGIENIKSDRKDVFFKIIKKLNPNWKGEYSSDNDFFYFVNLKVDTLYDEIENIEERNEKIVELIQNKLNINGRCIFSHLDFEDKTFPRMSRLQDDLSYIIQNEKQPLVVISPARDANKFIIPDDNLLIRCYKDDNTSLPIRIVIKTLLFQKAFIEYASTASVNITENSQIELSYSDLSKSFSKFIDYLWRVEISNSYYLNKSYRILGKLWLLNSKFENLKNQIDRNSTFEERENQNKIKSRQSKIENTINIIVIILGVFTIFSGIWDFDRMLYDGLNIHNSFFRLSIDALIAIVALFFLVFASRKITQISKNT